MKALFAAALALLACAASENAQDSPPLRPERVESSRLGPVRVLAIRFSDTVDHGRSIRPVHPGDSWARDASAPFAAKLRSWGIQADRLDAPDEAPGGKQELPNEKDGTPYNLERDRAYFLAERPAQRPGKRIPQRFDAYLLGDFVHREKLNLRVNSQYWARFTLLNREGAVVFSKVYTAALSTLAFNVNRVNREAAILDAQIPAQVLSDIKPFLKPSPSP